jgi:hypothetical protein
MKVIKAIICLQIIILSTQNHDDETITTFNIEVEGKYGGRPYFDAKQLDFPHDKIQLIYSDQTGTNLFMQLDDIINIAFLEGFYAENKGIEVLSI